ncbi:MAG: 1-acyl-sn-glycerol-3-phosphate acyltransferase [Saprospiraceae bacterium]
MESTIIHTTTIVDGIEQSQIQKQSHIIDEIQDWPIYKLYEKRSEFVEEINKNTSLRLRLKYKGKLDKLLARTIYMEKIRMKDDPWSADPQNEPIFWKKIQKSLSDTDADQEEIQNRSDYLLKKIVERYAEEIAGGFKKKTFLFARKFLSFFFRTLLNAASAKNIFYIFKSKHRIEDRIKLFGPLDKIRKLAKDGVLVIVPTHSSNMDSIMIGYALDEIAGLPAFSYGAGLNLYNNELVGYFMNRLGAYRVDRRKKNPVYLETLKTMSTISLQWGTNTLFFPGGTRSRSGEIETKLKLGLLGTAIEAQREIIKSDANYKNIYIVPVVLNYHCVLEARFLIEQHLRIVGKDSYMSSGRKDDFRSFKNVFVFLYRLLSQSSEIALSFGDPLDVIGNSVNDSGQSIDQHGKLIDIKDYFLPLDESEDVQSQRDNVYTSVLAEKIVESYLKHNMVFSTNLVAYAAFKLIKKLNSGLDVFNLLRLDPKEIDISLDELVQKVNAVQAILIENSKLGLIKLDHSALLMGDECVNDAIRKLGVFHASKPLQYLKTGKLGVGSLKILFFYHNRLENYDFLKA